MEVRHSSMVEVIHGRTYVFSSDGRLLHLRSQEPIDGSNFMCSVDRIDEVVEALREIQRVLAQAQIIDSTP